MPDAEKTMSEVLEAMIDKHSLDEVLEVLETICWEKEEHVRTNWQDQFLAGLWKRAAKGLQKICVGGI